MGQGQSGSDPPENGVRVARNLAVSALAVLCGWESWKGRA